MGVVIGICTKYPGGPTRIKATDMERPWREMGKCLELF